MKTLRLGILGSTRGSLLLPMIDAIAAGDLTAEIVVVASDKADSGILTRASQAAIPTVFVNPKGLTRQAFDQALHCELRRYRVDLLVMIGFMRIVSPWFVAQWPQQILNVHPSLLPKHSGLMDLAVHQAVLDSGDKVSGCTVHYVNEVVDGGQIVLQHHCPVMENDTADQLKSRVQALEAQALIDAVKQMSQVIV